LVIEGEKLGWVDVEIGQVHVAHLRISSITVRTESITDVYETEVHVTVCSPVEFQIVPVPGEVIVMARRVSKYHY
jgi:hypothetical protein